MSENKPLEGDARSIRLKKIAFRASHRGMKEMDILLGQFASTRLESLTDDELNLFEAMMFIPDQEFFKILMKDVRVPDNLDTPLMQELIAFTQNR